MQGLLLDLDGVMYVGDEPVPGAVEVADWLVRQRVPHLYVTNTSSRPRSALVDKLARMRVAVTSDQLLTPCVATTAWLREHAPGRPALLVPDATRTEFADLDPFVRALEYAAGVEAVVLGKPAADFYRLAVERLDLSADQVVMVGDDVRGDVGGAQQAGLAGVLVRTGKFTPADLTGEIDPTAVLDSIADLPSWWESTRVA
jgi:ribonucleotide monophosphatase NagD (HAD superfamily)